MSQTHVAGESSGGDHRFLAKPSTTLGWWAVWLAAGFLVLFLGNVFVFMPTSENAAWWRAMLPFYGIAMILVGIGSGVVALIAIIGKRERSWLVWLPLIPAAMMTFLVVGEFAGALLGYTH